MPGGQVIGGGSKGSFEAHPELFVIRGRLSPEPLSTL